MPYDDRGQAAAMRRSEWDRRVRRAADLAERFPDASQILTFYRHILQFQRSMYEEVSTHSALVDTRANVRQQLNADVCVRPLSALLELVEDHGTETLKQQARELASLGLEQQRELLNSFLASPDEDAKSFFARVIAQPYAEYKAGHYPPQPEGSAGPVCPVCGCKPQAAVLRPEGDGGKRFLLCSFCLTEWEFRRILCPMCNEEDHRKLPRYSAEELDAVRVEACDTCHCYLKSIDLTVDGLAVPLVDEVATVPLDLWAVEHGYQKVAPNLMGF